MSKFKYVGHGDMPPARINFMGLVEFELNKSVDVDDSLRSEPNACYPNGVSVVEKLKGNMSFEEVKPGRKKKGGDESESEKSSG